MLFGCRLIAIVALMIDLARKQSTGPSDWSTQANPAALTQGIRARRCKRFPVKFTGGPSWQDRSISNSIYMPEWNGLLEAGSY